MPDPAKQPRAAAFAGQAVLIGGLLLACYWPALRGSLLWDDAAHVTAPELRSLAGLGRIWGDLHATQQYYPVLHSAFWLEHRLWGDATAGYHLVNLGWHGLACCLLAAVLRHLWRASPGSIRPVPAGAEWVAAVLFAVHPVCVESVAWISEQKNTLSLVFYLAAALVYFEYRARQHSWLYGLALAFFLLALGIKSVTATLPAGLLVALWWKNGRLSWRHDVRPLIPWFLLGLAAGAATAWIERKLIGAEGAAFDLTVWQRGLLAGRVIWFYLGKLAWPANLMFVYPRWEITPGPGWFVWTAGALAVTAGFWAVRRRGRGLLAGWLFFTGSLLPAMGFFNVYPFIFSYVADHFQYLASLGIFATVAGASTRLFSAGSKTGRLILGWLGLLLFAALALLTNRQSRIYVAGETLYRATLARNSGCWMAHNNLAVILVTRADRANEAIDHYREALRLKPDYAEAHNNLAVELTKLPGHAEEAVVHCEQALLARPDYAEAHCNLANALVLKPGNETRAILHYEEALRLDPGNAAIHFSFANTLAKMPGHQPDALRHYGQAVQLNPRYLEAHVNLANELAKIPGRLSDALAHYELALQLNPGLAEVHYNLAVQLSNSAGREQEALNHYQKALRLQPAYPKAHNNLAILHARQHRYAEAREHWEKALQLDPDFVDARKNLELLDRLPAH